VLWVGCRGQPQRGEDCRRRLADQVEPWADTIGSALKAYKQARSYNIRLPHDLGVAMKKMLSRIVKAPTPTVSSAAF
jgi:hypothetical protein